MKLIQIPFSHNCVKVRVALGLKGLTYETQDIAPMDRASVLSASGQGLVPVLLDGGRAITDSTAILLYLEERHPDPPLVPHDPAVRAGSRPCSFRTIPLRRDDSRSASRGAALSSGSA